MTTTRSTEATPLPAPYDSLLELGLTDEQIAEARTSAPLVVACQADQHPGAVPRPRRPQRDTLGRKIEIEVGDAHCAGA